MALLFNRTYRGSYLRRGSSRYGSSENKLSSNEIDSQIHSLEAVSTQQDHVARHREDRDGR